MPYKLYQFDGLDIPGAAADHDIAPGRAKSALVALPGGRYYDAYGTDLVGWEATQATAKGLLIGTSAADLKSKLDSWRAKVRKSATLTRLSDGGELHSVTARLLAADAPRNSHLRTWVPITLTFEIPALPWKGTARAPVVTLTSSPKYVTCPNAGNVGVDDAVITITAPAGGSITNPQVTWAQALLVWTGTIPAGKALVIDCGAHSVKLDGAAAYDGFSLGAGHAYEEWLPLTPGSNDVGLIYGGTNGGTFKLEYCEKWA